MRRSRCLLAALPRGNVNINTVMFYVFVILGIFAGPHLALPAFRWS